MNRKFEGYVPFGDYTIGGFDLYCISRCDRPRCRCKPEEAVLGCGQRINLVRMMVQVV